MAKKGGISVKETFPKVAADCKISSCKKTKGGVDLRFDDLQITGSQFEQVSDWIDDESELILTIQQKQGGLFKPSDKKDAKDKSMAETVAAEENETV